MLGWDVDLLVGELRGAIEFLEARREEDINVMRVNEMGGRGVVILDCVCVLCAEVGFMIGGGWWMEWERVGGGSAGLGWVGLRYAGEDE